MFGNENGTIKAALSCYSNGSRITAADVKDFIATSFNKDVDEQRIQNYMLNCKHLSPSGYENGYQVFLVVK